MYSRLIAKIEWTTIVLRIVKLGTIILLVGLLGVGRFTNRYGIAPRLYAMFVTVVIWVKVFGGIIFVVLYENVVLSGLIEIE